MNEIGQRRRGIDWQARTSGTLRYAADIPFDNLLEARVLRSPYPHARVRAIDVSRAKAMPGVLAVATAADFPKGVRYLHEGAADRPPMADGFVRFVGQEVAAVAAETVQQAQAALLEIQVEYEILPAPLATGEALEGDTGRLHERVSGKANLSHAFHRLWGEPAKGREAAVYTVEGRFHFPRQAHACMETHVCVASWDVQAEKLHYWASTQSPYYVVREVAHVLGLQPAQVVCHEVGVGGGFGAKSKICDHEAIAGALSMLASRPVLLRLTREEEFETTKSRHAFGLDMRLHADSTGQLRMLDADIVVDNGAYNHSGVSVMGAGVKGLGMLYRPDGVEVKARLVDTALVPGGQFRGYGTTQTSYALECLMDDLARKLAIDPIDLRLLNANQPGDTTVVGAELGSARLTECLNAVRTALRWDEEKGLRRPGRGVGVSSGVHVSGSYTTPGSNRSDAAIDLFVDGRLRVRFGGSDAGTGQRTILAQVAAEEFGLALGSVDVLMMDSELTPVDMGAWASRGTHYGAHAVRKAAQAAISQLFTLAMPELGADGLRIEAGAVTNGQSSIGIAELVRRSPESRDGVLSFEASYLETSVVPADKATGRGNVSASYNFACHGAVVQVDTRTGDIRLLDYVAAHDVGTAINPIQVEGQIIGGAVMGIGLALGEEAIFEQGKMVNPAYLHYALPRAADVPTVRPVIVEGGDPRGPYGAKAIGECGINPPASAISNAVLDATGIRIAELPITPDKILTALAAREGRRRDHSVWRRPSRWWIALVRWAYPRGLFGVLHARTGRFSSQGFAPPLERIAEPTRLAEAHAMLDAGGTALGGGTDLQLLRRQGIVPATKMVSTGRIAELGMIEALPDGRIEIGAAVKLAALATALRSRIPVVAQTIDTIAGAQIRELATVGGNLAQAKRCWFYRNGFGCYKRLGGLAPCYAINGDHRFYHAPIGAHRCQATTPSDLATTLASLDAEVVIASQGGERVVPVEAFYTGPGETVLAGNEIVRSVRLPAQAAGRTGWFAKLRLWEGDFAIASVAFTASFEAGSKRMTNPALVFGGLAPTPWRARMTERALAGGVPHAKALRAILDQELDAEAHPLQRNGWKLDAAAGLAEQAFEALGGSVANPA